MVALCAKVLMPFYKSAYFIFHYFLILFFLLHSAPNRYFYEPKTAPDKSSLFAHLPNGMSDADGSTMNVDLGWIQAKDLNVSQHDHTEGFINLPH